MDALERTLRLAEVPNVILEDLDLEGDPDFRDEMIDVYLEADEPGRAAMVAFHLSGGPAKARAAARKG